MAAGDLWIRHGHGGQRTRRGGGGAVREIGGGYPVDDAGVGSHAEYMAIFRLWQGSRRLAAVDDYPFPSGVRQRCAQRHGELTGDGIQSAEAAARQWFRLCARHPRVRLAMPSVIVDDFWREFALHAREYAEFCDTAFGRFLDLPAEPATATDGVTASRATGLRATFRYARQDEPGGVPPLPMLFRVDQDLAIDGGHHYLADCGGRGTCYELKGTICLQHLGGPGRAPGGARWSVERPPPAAGGGEGIGCGAGCGGGN